MSETDKERSFDNGLIPGARELADYMRKTLDDAERFLTRSWNAKPLFETGSLRAAIRVRDRELIAHEANGRDRPLVRPTPRNAAVV